jgi:hypothetical protein
LRRDFTDDKRITITFDDDPPHFGAQAVMRATAPSDHLLVCAYTEDGDD